MTNEEFIQYMKKECLEQIEFYTEGIVKLEKNYKIIIDSVFFEVNEKNNICIKDGDDLNKITIVCETISMIEKQLSNYHTNIDINTHFLMKIDNHLENNSKNDNLQLKIEYP